MLDQLDRFGSPDGGMFVTVPVPDGGGQYNTRTWWLTALGGSGPFIPCVPPVVLAKRLAAGSGPEPGAQACMNLFGLDDFDEAIGDRAIRWHIAEQSHISA